MVSAVEGLSFLTLVVASYITSLGHAPWTGPPVLFASSYRCLWIGTSYSGISWTSSSSGHLLDIFFGHHLLVDLWTSSSDIIFWWTSGHHLRTSYSAGLVPQGNYIIAVMEIYNLKKKNHICSYSLWLALMHVNVPEPPWSRGVICVLCG